MTETHTPHRNLARYGSSRAHLPGEDGKPLCGRQYAHAPDYFRIVDKDANCGNCLMRLNGFATRKAQEAAQEAAQAEAQQNYTDHVYDHIVRIIGREGAGASQLHTLVHELLDCVETGGTLPQAWRNAKPQS